jgi:hypothetical protein
MEKAQIRSIAIYQKVILVCILLYIVGVLASLAMPPAMKLLVGLAMIPVGLVSMVFVLMLSLQLYSLPVGIILGLLTLVPLIGLIVLLRINGKATKILQEHGLKVGLLGASLSEV